MAQISSIGAGLFTEISYNTTNTPVTLAEFQALTPADFVDIPDVRDFPEFGNPANIVNVPVYGALQSSQVNAQADAPTLEITLNYNATDHDTIEALINDGLNYSFRIRLANVAKAGTDFSNSDEFASFYVIAKFASLNYTPSLSDTNQATLTLSTVGDYFGPSSTIETGN